MVPGPLNMQLVPAVGAVLVVEERGLFPQIVQLAKLDTAGVRSLRHM